MKIEIADKNHWTQISVYKDSDGKNDCVELDIHNEFKGERTASSINLLSKSDAHKLGTELIRLSDAL